MERYTEKAKEALILAAEAAEETGSRTVGTEHILVGLMKEGTGTAARVLEAGDVKLERVLELEKKLVSSSQPTQIRDREGYTPIARKVLENSYREAVRFHAPLIGTEHILMAMLKQTDCVAVRLLNTLNINIQRLYIDLLSAMGEEGAAGREELVQGRSGRDGKADTPVLDEYSRDLTKLAAEGKLDPVIGREHEIGRVIQILSRRTKNNPCLIGEPGVGKTAVTEGLAQMIAAGDVPDTIRGKRVVGQEEAVTAVSKAIRRGRVGLKDPRRPIGSFLFLGPTGVGKTELCKALAEAMFGTENALIRVDMSEYMEKHSVSKMIGSPPGYVGYEGGGQLSEKVRRNPYSVILFDEVEKAHPDVFNILLQVLDDGHITDSQGHKIDFKNTIVIMTSNAGAENIIAPRHLGFTSQDDEKARYTRMKTGVMDEVKRLFKPEFLNRIDEIIVFHPLSKTHMKEIVSIMLNTVGKRTKQQMSIRLNAGEDVKDFLVEKGYDEKYGARPLRRTIQNLVEDKLAEAVLEGRVREGDSVKLLLKDGQLKFSARHPQTARKQDGVVV